MKEFWTSLATLMGVLAFFQSQLQSVFPPELRFAFTKFFNQIFLWVSPYCYFDITEIDGVNSNELYNSVQIYLSSSASTTGNRLSLTKALNSSSFTFGLSNNGSTIDTFNGVAVWWEHTVTQRQSQTFSWRPLPEEKRGFTLKIKKKDKSLILDSYLDHIMNKANEIRRKNKDRLLYTNSGGGSADRGHPWECVPFKHPSTFETLAMDPVKKSEIMDDLLGFAEGESFYQQTGRAWKRGYLLFGPPGTGKSSMIAAMANFLGYDIYDLELTEVSSNSDLRKLLMKTTSKSIIVIEDIDCSIDLTNRKKPTERKNQSQLETEMRNGSGSNSSSEGGNSMTLSGLLNFTDGLWSCCGSERIFVFTTNHVEKLDPALLRSGRMDMHINMSFCSFEALKILLKNYVGLKEEDMLENGLVKEMEEVMDEAEMTPADISEVLIKNRRNKENALKELLESLKREKVKKKKKKKRMSEDVVLMKEEKSSLMEVTEEEEKRELEREGEGCDKLLENYSKRGDGSEDEGLEKTGSGGI
ncbi:AAA+ ATPase domain [Macleaya cordata]|uniref:AAA+ ATPase domain n=1 Tax=Macleaya cordata TaxID=56857 RepID=A0A200RE17_MACCD|nr:AAA+ ATPase domain [Macleaya cordata]